jgi:hypothetical protein
MKKIELKLYSFSELSPEAQERVIENEAERVDIGDSLYQMLDSAKAVTKACNLTIGRYSWRTNEQNYCLKVSGNSCSLEGHKALAWFLRILIGHGYARPKKFADMQFPGVCGFTGVCYDETVAETVWKELLDGESVSAAFNTVAYKFCKLAESELEYLQSGQGILGHLDQSAEIYTEDGEELNKFN